jgi:integrase
MGAVQKLTDRKITAAKLPLGKGEISLSDGAGLYLRVRAAADGGVVRQWIFVSKRAGKTSKVGLGGHPEVGLHMAREKAHRLRTTAGAMTRDAADAAVKTVGDLFDLMERVRPPAAGRAELFERHCRGPLGATRLADFDRRTVAALLDGILRRGRLPGAASDFRRTAGAVFGLVRQLAHFGLSRGLLTIDPTAGMKRSHFGHQGVPRERVLSAEELTDLARRMVAVRRVGPRGREFDMPALSLGHAAAVRFLLATAARVGELAAAQSEHFDLVQRRWIIPAEVAKNSREHTVHLSDFALHALADLRKWPTGTACAAQLAKALHGRQQIDAGSGDSRHAHNDALVLSGGRWTPHDLRRTAATTMQRLGVRTEVIEACLNHKPQGIVAVYQRDDLWTERAAALDLLGAELQRLMSVPD